MTTTTVRNYKATVKVWSNETQSHRTIQMDVAYWEANMISLQARIRKAGIKGAVTSYTVA